MSTAHPSLFAFLRYGRYRAASRLRCALGIHRWRGYHDCGDEVNVLPISGYKRPHGANDFRTCSWCGKHHCALACDDGAVKQFFIWAARV